MHALPCPSCQALLPISPSQAGQQTLCPHCQAAVEVPTLGTLRQLPPVNPSQQPAEAAAKSSDEGASLAFLALGLLATAALVVAAYCGIRWALIDVPLTTEGHVAQLAELYQELTPAELVLEYEQIEQYGIELSGPYGYKQIENEKAQWGGNALIAAAVGGIAILAAGVVMRMKRPRLK